MGPRAGLDGRKISSPPGFDPVPSSPQSVAIPTELSRSTVQDRNGRKYITKDKEKNVWDEMSPCVIKV